MCVSINPEPLKMKLYYLIFLLLFLSCKKEKDVMVTLVDCPAAERTVTRMDISSLLKVKKITFLQTSDSSLVGKVDKVYKSSGRYYIQSDNKTLKVFDAEGKYLRQIGSLGGGPEEFSFLTDFDVDTEHVYILTARKILIYDREGKYERSVSFPMNVSGFKVIGDKYLMFVLGEKNVVYLTDAEGNIQEKRLERNEALRLARAVPFISYGTDKILFQKGSSNDLLSYDLITGNFEDMVFIASDDALSSGKENELLQTSEFKRQDLLSYGTVFDGLTSSSTQTIFGSIKKGDGLTLWVKDHVKGTQKAYALSSLRDDITYTSPDFFARENTYSPESFLTYVQPYRILEGLEKNAEYAAEANYKKMKSLLDSIADAEDANPVVIEYAFE